MLTSQLQHEHIVRGRVIHVFEHGRGCFQDCLPKLYDAGISTTTLITANVFAGVVILLLHKSNITIT